MYDSVVIGAGVSGLAAARHLVSSGAKALVLEARPRLGGRIFTAEHSCGAPIELGAELVHELLPSLDRALSSAGSAVIAGEGAHYRLRGSRLVPFDEFWEPVSDRLSKLPVPRGKDRSMADLLGKPRSNVDRLTYQFVEGFNAAPASALSASALLRSHRDAMKAGGYRSYRPLNGYSSLIQGLCADIPEGVVREDARVHEVSWSRGKAVVSYRAGGRHQQVVAKTILTTVPTPVLAAASGASAIRFSPDLPSKRELAAQVGVGSVVKVVVLLRDRKILERRVDLETAQFFHLDGQMFPIWWTSYPLRTPVLTGWVGGPRAEKLLSFGRSAFLEGALNSLGTLLDVDLSAARKAAEKIWVHDWHNDPFAKGAYSFVRVGCGDVPKELARSVQSTLFFAGEALGSTDVGGTVGSALESGEAAAKKIVRALG
ncbi:MAG: NAD(P)/FAD-dependent oxidoreductase [Bdellovibrionota bacterium]